MGSTTARTEAFSDAIFAIAMTLLVLEIKLPAHDADLLPALAQLWPSILAFVASFLYVGTYWLNHHAAFTRLARVNGVYLLLNLVFLMTISFVSFPTALLAERLVSGHEMNIAVAFYGLAMLLTAITGTVSLSYALRTPSLLAEGVDRAQVRAQVRGYWVGPMLYGASIPVALLVPVAALVFYVLGPVFYGVVAARDRGWSA